MAMDYFELAQASSIRMCWELEKRIPDFGEEQLELMRYLCLVAYNSEIHDGVCQDAWLRTTIKLTNPLIFSDPDRTLLLNRLKQNVFQISSLSSSIEIRSHILPRKAYWDRQQELQRSSFWTRVLLQLSMLDCWRIISSGLTERGFLPLTVLVRAVVDKAPLTQMVTQTVTEWRRLEGISCDLATHFRRSDRDVPHACLRDTLRRIKRDDVEFSMGKNILGMGSAGIVYKVVWKHGTYAMKCNKYGATSQKELDIASKVFHAHIVHGFGCCEVDGQSCLLMEALKQNLWDYTMEKARGWGIGLSFLRGATAEPLFSPLDTFDVLLQIARALEHCHNNNVVHGDLNTRNILFDHFEMFGNGRHFLAKVADFSHAQYITQDYAFCPDGGGTTQYAAPELLKWRVLPHQVKFSDPKMIDVYGFGAVAHEVLTGYPVYEDCWLETFNDRFIEGVIKGHLKPCKSNIWRNLKLIRRFPADLTHLVERCWELHPEERPTFKEICARLVQLRECAEEIQLRNRVADLRKFKAAVFLMVFICCTSLVKERRFADPIEFIALILFAFISLFLLMKFSVDRLMKFVR